MLQNYRFSIAGVGGPATVKLTLEDPATYVDREGYDPSFLGPNAYVPLPTLNAVAKKDAARVKGGGTLLDYHHFSTVHSKSRRLPMFSACNVDGKLLKKKPRSNVWHFDPRIPTDLQIVQECYGNSDDDLFSRGHMTRREDPVWGASSLATTAEADTFHATNAVPQMQGHNAGIWRSLEDYVLKNAGKDKQRACVITGPVLDKKDPKVRDVKIPVQLWKIVAFIHKDTDALAAVGYLSSQAAFLPDTATPSFVWGQFKDLQVPVRRIAKLTGLGFGTLLRSDVLAAADISFAFALRSEKDLLLR